MIIVGITDGEIRLRGHKPAIDDAYGPNDFAIFVEVLEWLGLAEIHNMRMSSDMDRAAELGFPGAMKFFQQAVETALIKISGKAPMRNRFHLLRKPPTQGRKPFPRKSVSAAKLRKPKRPSRSEVDIRGRPIQRRRGRRQIDDATARAFEEAGLDFDE